MHVLHKLLQDEFSCHSYSGRGMGGKRCLSVQLDSVADIGGLFAFVLHSENSLTLKDVGSIANAFRQMSQDSLGKGIVVYFPSVEFQE